MTEYTVKRLQDAPTIKELRDRLDEVIAMIGDDATWNGFDDEGLYIYPKKGEEKMGWSDLQQEKLHL
jgi:hypothetical protein